MRIISLAKEVVILNNTHKKYAAVFLGGMTLILTAVSFSQGKGKLSRTLKADLTYGVTVSTSDFDESFIKLTKSGNPITFHYLDNSLINETMLTGLTEISFSSSNKGLTLLTGYDIEEKDYLYERHLINDGSNTFNVSLMEECYFKLTPIDINESLNVENLEFSYSCSGISEEVFDSRLKFTYNKSTAKFSVAKKQDTFDSKDTNTLCLIPRYYRDETHGKCDVTSIVSQGFTSSNIEEIHIPSTITSIGDQAFQSCSKLVNVYLPDSVTKIGYDGFSRCSKLKNIRLSENLKTLGNSVFQEDKVLESIHLPDSITTMGNSLFYNCSLLKDVNCPRGIKTLETSVFYKTPALKTFTITSNVTSLNGYVFRSCSGLEVVNYEGTISNWKKIASGDWYYSCPLLNSVICSDGEVTL